MGLFLIIFFWYQPYNWHLGTWYFNKQQQQKILITWSTATVISHLTKNEPELTSGMENLKGKEEQGTGTSSKLTKVSCEQVRVCRGRGFRYILPNSFLIGFRNGGLCKLAQWKSLSYVQLFMTPWIVAHQATLSMEFSRQEYWIRLPFPSPGDLPDLGTEPASLMSLAVAGGFFTSATWEAHPPQKKPIELTIELNKNSG